MNDTTLPVAVPSAAVSTGRADAELLTLLAEHAKRHEEFDALPPDAENAEFDRMSAYYGETYQGLKALRPATHNGLIAKARLVLQREPDSQELMEQIVEDFVRLHDQPAPSESHPDAELLALAAEHSQAVEKFYAIDEHAEPEAYERAEARYIASVHRMNGVQPPATVTGARALAKAILLDASDEDGEISFESATSMKWVGQLLRGVASHG